MSYSSDEIRLINYINSEERVKNSKRPTLSCDIGLNIGLKYVKMIKRGWL